MIKALILTDNNLETYLVFFILFAGQKWLFYKWNARENVVLTQRN